MGCARARVLVRFADDALVMCRSREQAEAALARLRALLAELGLETPEGMRSAIGGRTSQDDPAEVVKAVMAEARDGLISDDHTVIVIPIRDGSGSTVGGPPTTPDTTVPRHGGATGGTAGGDTGDGAGGVRRSGGR
jgi:hypothetical protein